MISYPGAEVHLYLSFGMIMAEDIARADLNLKRKKKKRKKSLKKAFLYPLLPSQLSTC